jgi:hypothetical protein
VVNQTSEECDGAAGDCGEYDCTASCTCGFCGDGIVNGPEECESDGDCGAGEICTGCTCVSTGDCRVTLEVGDVKASPGDADFQVPVSMNNQYDEVMAIETVLLDSNNDLICTGCTPTDRAPGFMCFAHEQLYGECKVIMATLSPDVPIAGGGNGTIFTVDYAATCAPSNDCITINPVKNDTIISDKYEDPIMPVCVGSGEICFLTCGDVYPGGDTCGDGMVNIFDILEEIDMVLGIDIDKRSDCQLTRANVPTSLPPECEDPDPVGTQPDILDILVIIDKALDKPNCCDCYYFDDCS